MKIMKNLKFACLLNLFFVLNIFCARQSIKVFFPGVKPLLPKMLELINGEKRQIDFAQYTLLHPEIVHALTCAARRGIKISGVVDQNSIDQLGKHILLRDKHAKHSAELLKFLQKHKIDIYAKHGHVMHNKIMCFAQNDETGGPIVATGSANCTVSGLNSIFDTDLLKDSSHNFENLLIIQGNRKIYEQYRQEIHRIKKEVERQRRK